MKNKYHTPKNTRIFEEIFVVLSEDEDGTNGIVSCRVGNEHFPMVFGKRELIDLMIPELEKVQRETGKKMKIYRFTHRIPIKEIIG